MPVMSYWQSKLKKKSSVPKYYSVIPVSKPNTSPIHSTEKLEMTKNEIHSYTWARNVTLGRKAVLDLKQTSDKDNSRVFCRARMESLLLVQQRGINE